MPEPIHGEDPPIPKRTQIGHHAPAHLDEQPPYKFVDQPESKPGYKPPSAGDLGFTKGDTGAFTSEDEQLQLAIQGRALMAISTPAPLRDGSYRIALSPNESWVVKSVLMSGLDSSTEIVLILTPRI